MTVEQFARASHRCDQLRHGGNAQWEDLSKEEQEDYIAESKEYLRMSREDQPLWVRKIITKEN